MIGRIFKYPLSGGSVTQIQMPVGSVVLHFEAMECGVCMWAMSSGSESKTETRKFRMVATGEVFDFKGSKYYQTVTEIDPWDSLKPRVSHIFEVPA